MKKIELIRRRRDFLANLLATEDDPVSWDKAEKSALDWALRKLERPGIAVVYYFDDCDSVYESLGDITELEADLLEDAKNVFGEDAAVSHVSVDLTL